MNDYRPNRRTLLRDGAGAGLGLAGLSLVAGRELLGGDEAVAAPACTLSPELTEGPYYLDLEKIRKNITEGKAGLRLDLRVTIVNASTCEPIEDVAVDIWHADASGVYSGIGSEGTSGKTYLRGVQLTDANGVASFRTVYPGWYQGRATHIHLKTHVGGRSGGSTYSGGHVAHTGQLPPLLRHDDRPGGQAVAVQQAHGRAYAELPGQHLRPGRVQHPAAAVQALEELAAQGAGRADHAGDRPGCDAEWGLSGRPRLRPAATRLLHPAPLPQQRDPAGAFAGAPSGAPPAPAG